MGTNVAALGAAAQRQIAEKLLAEQRSRAQPIEQPRALSFTLPLPPSVNSYKEFSPGGQPYNTKQYRAWMKEAGSLINIQRQEQGGQTLFGDIAVDITFERKGDLDNRIKPLLDGMEDGGVLHNDRQIVRIFARFGDVKGCVVRLVRFTE